MCSTMGLDNYATNTDDGIELTPEQGQAFLEEGIELCGGMFSGEGGSFRGKVYARLMHEITGESLYQYWIPLGTVKEMHQALAACDPHRVIEETEDWGRHPEEIMELRKFFRVCAEHELGLVGWWQVGYGSLSDWLMEHRRAP